CEEPEVAYGRDRGKRGAGLGPAHTSRRAEEYGDDVRDAEADEAAPGDGGGGRAHQKRAAEPEGGHRPRCAEQPAGSEQADQAVAAEAAGGHGERERGEACGRDRRGRRERGAQVDGAPVGTRAL